MNKKGKEVYVSIWNFILWAAVFGMFLIGIYIFNRSETDIRGEEARILAKRVADCVTENEFLLQDSTNLLSVCSLDKILIADSGKFFIKIEFPDIQNSIPITIGNFDLEIQCGIKNSESTLATCYSTKISSANHGTLKITTASNNQI